MDLIKEIQEIIDLFEKYSITELTLESNGTKITLKKDSFAPVPEPAKKLISLIRPENTSPKNENIIQKSDFVGIFYRAVIENKNSELNPIKIGDSVKKGQVIGYINTAKYISEIKAEVEGKIISILENDEPVEYSQSIIEIQLQPQQP